MSAAPAASEGMSLADLERLRLCLPGCEVAMLADVSARTVLGASAALSLPQEHHDALCDQACRALSYGGRARPYAVIAGPGGVRLHLRAPDYPDEVLCLVLPPQSDIGLALSRAEAALAGRDLPGACPDAA